MNFCSFEQPEFRCLLETFPLTKKLAVLSYFQKLGLSPKSHLGDGIKLVIIFPEKFAIAF